MKVARQKTYSEHGCKVVGGFGWENLNGLCGWVEMEL